MDKSGPAFPEMANSTSGLTKREFFAGLAMAGGLANPHTRGEVSMAWATHYADKLLAELAKEEGA